ncbi:MAG: hypothetical protein HS114_10085 [Anaerolineales bacterium]|nr:hypothetical protein [Anaerolineales bacterium]
MSNMYAWAAGLIDGEGYFRIIKDPCYSARLSVKMCHKPTITRLYEIFGVGNIKRAEVARPGHAQSWIWTCSSRTDVIEVLRLIRPYLFTKADEADIMIEFMDSVVRLNSAIEEKERLRVQLVNLKTRNRVRQDNSTEDNLQ